MTGMGCVGACRMCEEERLEDKKKNLQKQDGGTWTR